MGAVMCEDWGTTYDFEKSKNCCLVSGLSYEIICEDTDPKDDDGWDYDYTGADGFLMLGLEKYCDRFVQEVVYNISGNAFH